jgi:hypothetical protein
MDQQDLERLSALLGNGVMLSHTTKLWAAFDLPGARPQHLALWGPKKGSSQFSRIQGKLVNRNSSTVQSEKLREGYQREANVTLRSLVASGKVSMTQMQNLWQSAGLADLLKSLDPASSSSTTPQFTIVETFTETVVQGQVPWS